MLTIKLANATNRIEVAVDKTATLESVLTSNGFATTGVTIHINGTPCTDISKSLAELNVPNNAMIMAVPAQKAGC